MPGELRDVESATPRSHGLHLREMRQSTREADFVASSDAVDAYDEIVEQSWVLERFRANPVVLYAHQSRELPIGQATRVELVEGNLETTIRFASAQANPKAEQVWKLLQEGALRAVSVGFVPKTVRYEKRNGQDVYVLADNELHEISVVPIPANPEALAKMKAKALAAATVEAGTKALQPADTAPENVMTEKEFQDQLAKSAAEKALAERLLSDANKALDASKATVTALETQNKALAGERDASIERATKSEDKLIELEVDALVGTKIAPAEKDDFVALRKSNPELYTKFVAQRGDKKLLASVIQPKLPPPTNLAGVDAEPDLSAEAMKST